MIEDEAIAAQLLASACRAKETAARYGLVLALALASAVAAALAAAGSALVSLHLLRRGKSRAAVPRAELPEAGLPGFVAG
jgi:hypothetical protein